MCICVCTYACIYVYKPMCVKCNRRRPKGCVRKPAWNAWPALPSQKAS